MNSNISYRSRAKRYDKFWTRMEKEEIKEMRHGRMSTSERLREWSANFLRLLLLFGFPVILSLVVVIVLVAIFVVRPYTLTKDFTRTKCEVSGHTIINQTSASCNSGTDPFYPCIRVNVLYATGTEDRYQNGILMENEQALVNCNPCSYTFGQHGLLHEYQDACDSWKEFFDPTPCVNHFIAQYAVEGSVFPCYFNPHQPDQVVRNLILNVNMLIHAVVWPILSCLIYLLAWGFVCYDAKQNRLIDHSIRQDLSLKRTRQQMARQHAAEWRKQKLGQTLGVRSEISNGFARNSESTKKLSLSMPSLCSLNNNHVDMKPLQLSESTDNTDTDDDGNFDLRHLDLAVSQHNINGLANGTYGISETQPPLTYENVAVSHDINGRPGVGASHRTLPIFPFSPLSTFRRPVHRGNKFTQQSAYDVAYSSFSIGDRYRKTKISKIRTTSTQMGFQSFGPIPRTNGNMFYQEERPDSGISDSDAAVSEDEIDGYYSVGRRYTDIPIQTVNMYTANDESNV